jgi:hypothetical protein
MKNSGFCMLLCISLLAFILLFSSSVVRAQWDKIVIDTLGANSIIFPGVGDIENDGDMDVLVTQFSEEPPTGNILLYTSPDWTRHVIEDDMGVMEVADLNDDHQNDIVAANFLTGNVVWYEAPLWTRRIIGTLPFAWGVDVVDLDKDQDLDVVATGVEPNQIVWFEPPYWIFHTIAGESTSPTDPFQIISTDIDDDNDIDVIVTSENGVTLFEAPAWNGHSIYNTDEDGYGQIDIADIDGDNDLDILFGGPGDTVSWYENPSWTPRLIDSDLPGAWGIAAAYVDDDDVIDVIACGEVSGEVVWYKSPAWEKHVIDSSLTGVLALSTADIAGSNRLDIVACGRATGYVVVYINPYPPTSVLSDDPSIEVPRSFKLYQNYPNPFNPVTEIRFELLRSGQITLEVFDLLGKKVRTLVSGHRSAGIHEMTFDAKDLATGVYFYRLQSGHATKTRKMLLLR